MTEVKKMLDTFLPEQKKQAKIIEANSKELKALSRRKRGRPDTARLRARVNHQHLDFSAPRATRGNPEDLPPPPPRRETDKSPERVVDISDQEEPAPTKRARAADAEGGRQEQRASDTQSASGSSKTEIVKDTSEYTNYSSKQRNKKERERSKGSDGSGNLRPKAYPIADTPQNREGSCHRSGTRKSKEHTLRRTDRKNENL
ncbi:hypothetical protein AALP_AAs48547U000300 [Arabis alpina]|nr:hypothetical protein AALP_AAs48547U000300 [Arabis alpina]